MKNKVTKLAASVLFAAAFTTPASAAELLVNGDFEAGSFAGWTVTDLAGGSGTTFIDTPGTTTPMSGFPTSAAGGLPHGSFYAVTDQTAPGTHVLEQSFAVGAGKTVVLSFDLFANDSDGGPIVNPAGLTHLAGANQHARVDLLVAGSGAFSTAPLDILGTFYLGVDAGPDPHAFTHYSIDISALVAAGGVFDLRFAQVDNAGFFQMGVDNASVNATPAPASLALLALGLAGLGWSRRRKA